MYIYIYIYIYITANPCRLHDTLGNTPLHVACFRGHLSCVTFLLESAADATIVNANGESLVHAAAMGNQVACLRLVVEVHT